jgi:hypothetical protein
MTKTPSRRAWFALAALMALTVLVYWPSLRGGYTFDDSIYYVSNPDIHVTSLQPSQLWRAARSQCDVNPLCRPLSSLTFAVNWYFTGLDPFWPKLTNVVIHLLNGWLLFLLLRELFRLNDLVRRGETNRDLVAAILAGAWLLLPINLTGVAYVSQRMEALANLFVFLGLFGYLRARQRVFRGAGGGAMLWVSIAACTGLGLTAKEDAALLPLFTACAEFAITGFRNNDRQWCKPAIGAHVGLLIAPMIAGLLWIAPSILHGFSGYRNFTLVERVLTESRVIVDYIQWTLLPNVNELSFYHDDIAISHGMLDPPTTLAAILALLALLGSAIWQRKTRPLFCLGILWFFAGHAMTGTIIPLELVFEHRNYFPSVGLLLAATSLLALEPVLRLGMARVAIAAAAIVLFAFTTFLRAEEWSHPLRLAYSEALKRPGSQRAQYELARTLIVAAGKDDASPLIGEASKILERNAFRPDSGIAPLQALIYINARAHRTVDPRWWQAIVDKLHRRPATQTDIDSVIFLYRCQQRGECTDQPHELFEVFVAALPASRDNPNLLSAYADFAMSRLHDPILAVRMARQVVSAKPKVAVYRSNLVKLLILAGRFDDARREIEAMRPLDIGGSLDASIADLDAELAQAMQAAAANAQTPAADAAKPGKPVD